MIKPWHLENYEKILMTDGAYYFLKSSSVEEREQILEKIAVLNDRGMKDPTLQIQKLDKYFVLRVSSTVRLVFDLLKGEYLILDIVRKSSDIASSKRNYAKK